MTIRDRIMDIAALVVVCCLVVLVVRSFGTGDRASADDRSATAPTEIDDWLTLVDGGHQSGNPSAPVTIITFVDFECPACQAFALGAERTVRKRYPQSVRWVVRQFPLEYHRLAYHAAKAAECAAKQHRFHNMYDLLFEKQDSLGVKSFTSFASESGVADTALF